MPATSKATASPTRFIAPLCLAGAVLLWGTSFMATKEALTGFAPLTVIWLRMAMASILVLPVCRRIPRPRYRSGDWKTLAFLSLMQPCLYYFLESHALKLTTSSQAGMISAIVPLLVGAGAWVMLREPMSLRTVVGLLVSIGGVVWLSLGGPADESAPNPMLGNLMELGAMVSVAVYMVVMKGLSARYSTWWLTCMQCVVGALFFLPSAVAGGLAPFVQAPAEAWVAVLYLGMLVTLGGFGLYNMGMTYMPAGRAAMSLNMVSPVALVAGWLVLGESLTPTQLAACAVVGVGVWLGRR